jgi:acetyltransferase
MAGPMDRHADQQPEIPEEERHPLDAFFHPRAVAVIGASDRPGSVGRNILWNLISSPFGGTVYAVNPKRHNVLGIKTWSDVQSLPEPADLAMIITPAPTVPSVLRDCVAAGVKSAIIISAGFRETGEAGNKLLEEVREIARNGKIRLIGPNSLGVMNPITGLNAAYAFHIAQQGTVGFVSQSGAICASVLDWSFRNNVGFSAFVSFGHMADVGWPDLIYYLGNDRNTKSIVIYLQGIGDARSFLSAAREVALAKPIIVLKAGQTREGADAALPPASELRKTICLDSVLDAAFRRSGVVRVNDIESLFSMAEALGKQPRPRGRRLIIIGNSAGPNILATDALVAGGGKLPALSEDTMAQLNNLLPPYWNHRNPVDIVGDADADRYARAAEIVLRDEESDGVLVVLTPQVRTEPTATARQLAALKLPKRKPVLASWMGGITVEEGETILNDHNIPTFPYPDTAARVFNAMWQYTYNLNGIYETPSMPSGLEAGAPIREMASGIFEMADAENRTSLTTAESHAILQACGISFLERLVAQNAQEAADLAARIGYPVVLRYHSEKAEPVDAGGVLLNLPDDNAVREAFGALRTFYAAMRPGRAFPGVAVQPVVPKNGFELILGSSIDPQFGPFLYFGSGGPWGEALRDRTVALPPLNTTLARRMMEQTRIYTALQEGRGGMPPDIGELEQLLVRFSHLAVEQRRIREIEINPLLVTPERMVALNARMELHPAGLAAADLPKPAIRPYPQEYVTEETMKDGAEILIRPIRPEDEPLMVKFHEGLSRDTVYFRFLRVLGHDQLIRHERLTRLCFIDYDRAMALVAVAAAAGENGARILGLSRFVKLHGTADADFAIMIRDDYQGRGLGKLLLGRLAEVAKAEQIKRLTGIVHPENRGMLHLCSRLGFQLHKPAGEEVTAEKMLTD